MSPVQTLSSKVQGARFAASRVLRRGWRITLLSGAVALVAAAAWAYPPGPCHVLYGTVRDPYGTPINLPAAEVWLTTPSGSQYSAPIVPLASPPGVNYLLKVPLDSGGSPDPYEAGALLPAAAYTLRVRVGAVESVPLEIGTNYLALGSWAKATRLDLTLGTDSNRDGLPDAWEYAFLATLGINMPLSSLTANSILTSDGLTLRQEYLLATSLFTPGVPLVVSFGGFSGASPILQFPAVKDRSYTVLESLNLTTWTPVSFQVAGEAAGTPARSALVATATGPVEVYLASPVARTGARFYRIQVN